MADDERAETLAELGEFAVIDGLIAGRPQPPTVLAAVAIGPLTVLRSRYGRETGDPGRTMPVCGS